MQMTQKVAAVTASFALALFAARGLQAQVVPSPAAPAPATKQALPPEKGLALINERCSGCHESSLVISQRKTPEEWAATVQLMVERGATLSEDEMNLVLDFLDVNFHPAAPAQPAG